MNLVSLPLNQQISGQHKFERTSAHELEYSQSSRSTPVVFVVDDDARLRESLELLISSAGWQVKTFGSAEEFLDCPRSAVPNCLVLELSLPGLDGLNLQRRVAIECPHMPVVFVTDQSDVPSTVQAMKAGAIEFLTKPLNDDVLLGVIREALECSRVALRKLAETKALESRYASLTNREREVMTLVVSGLLNKQVAGELGISEITVKAHRGKVMAKMKADSLADLVKMANRLSLDPA